MMKWKLWVNVVEIATGVENQKEVSPGCSRGEFGNYQHKNRGPLPRPITESGDLWAIREMPSGILHDMIGPTFQQPTTITRYGTCLVFPMRWTCVSGALANNRKRVYLRR